MPRKPIRDRYTAAPVSRQRKWALRNRDLGLCVVCSEPVSGTSCYCEAHKIARRLYAQRWREEQRLRKEQATGKPARKRGRPKKQQQTEDQKA